jgi:beta-phosphoglucomutase
VFNGVIFDFDGVIVDSHPVHKRAWKKLLESLGRETSEEELQFVLDGRKRDDILRHFLGVLSANELDELGHRKEQFFREQAIDVQPVDGLLSLLKDLGEANIPLGIASSGSRNRLDFLLDRLCLKRHFQVIVTGDEIHQGKPDPAVFLRAAKDLGRPPYSLMVFEDAFSGVKAAKSAGMMVIGIAQADRAPALIDAGARHVVPDFRPLSYPKLQEMFA